MSSPAGYRPHRSYAGTTACTASLHASRYCRSVIARIWRGVVGREDAAAYAEYIGRTGMAEYRSTPGNQGAWMLRRDDGDRSEIITFSLWDSGDSVRGFAGEDIDQAVLHRGRPLPYRT